MGWRPSWGARHPRLARWAAILLPFVFAARALLLVFQLRSEHHPVHHADDPPAWPPQPGEVIRFRSNAHLGPWDRAPMVVEVTRKDFLDQPTGTGCMLDPPSMAHGGQLTLVSHDLRGVWRADWVGSPTIPAFNKAAPLPEGIDASRAVPLHAAEDCGTDSRLELTTIELLALVNFLSGQPPPPPDPATPRRTLTIRIDAPPPE